MIAITPQFTVSHGPRKLEAGETLIVEDVTAGEILMRSPAEVVKMSPKAIRLAEIPTGGTLLIVRPGGYGDLLFLTPVFRAIKLARPDICVTLCCFRTFADILLWNPDVDEGICYPPTRDQVERFDSVAWLENAIEFSDQAETAHAVDLFARRLGVEVTEKACRLFLAEEERLAALTRFPKAIEKKRIGIQVKASQACRTYPPKLLQEVIELLIDEGKEVFLFDRPNSVKVDRHPLITNLPVEDPPVSFRESCAILATCEGFIAPDSALCHVAGALSVPTVGLYGPFPWQLRVAYHPSVYAFNGVCRMSPCFHHERAGNKWPEGGPCELTGQCEALASIPPKRIVAKLNQLLK